MGEDGRWETPLPTPNLVDADVLAASMKSVFPPSKHVSPELVWALHYSGPFAKFANSVTAEKGYVVVAETPCVQELIWSSW
jgi:hypothetical protein